MLLFLKDATDASIAIGNSIEGSCHFFAVFEMTWRYHAFIVFFLMKKHEFIIPEDLLQPHPSYI